MNNGVLYLYITENSGHLWCTLLRVCLFGHMTLLWSRPVSPLPLPFVFVATAPARTCCRESCQGSFVSSKAVLWLFSANVLVKLVLVTLHLITLTVSYLLNTYYLFRRIGGGLVPVLINFFEIAFLFSTKIQLLVKETLSSTWLPFFFHFRTLSLW